MTWTHLDLKDVFMARYISLFYDHAQHLLSLQKTEALRQRKGTLDREIFQAIDACHKNYERACVTRSLSTLWCVRCRQLKAKDQFSDYHSNQNRPASDGGRFCWRCSRNSNAVFKVNGVKMFLCENSEVCTEPKRAGDGYWELRAHKVCPGCWETYKNCLNPWRRQKYVFVH